MGKYIDDEVKQTSEHLVKEGMTAEDLREIAYAQRNGIKIKTMPGNVDPSYRFPIHEHLNYHVIAQRPGFDPETGEPVDKPKHKKFNKAVFPHLEKTGGFNGIKITILHDPTKPYKIPDSNESLNAEIKHETVKVQASSEKKDREILDEATVREALVLAHGEEGANDIIEAMRSEGKFGPTPEQKKEILNSPGPDHISDAQQSPDYQETDINQSKEHHSSGNELGDEDLPVKLK